MVGREGHRGHAWQGGALAGGVEEKETEARAALVVPKCGGTLVSTLAGILE